MSTQKDKAEQKKRERLAEMQDQIEQGKLKVRQMTPEERKQNPPRQRQNEKKR